MIELAGGERRRLVSGEVSKLRPAGPERAVLLTIDVGNSNTVLGVFDGAELRAHWRLTTRREQTADEYGILVRNLFAGSGLEPRAIEGVALASVVPPLTPVLVELARELPRAVSRS